MGDSPESGDMTLRWKLGYVTLCFAVFALFAALGEPDRGVVAAISFASIVLAAKIRWDLRHNEWFWWFIALAALLHLSFVISYNKTIEVHPTILIAAPAAFGDFSALILMLFLIERFIAGKE